MDVHPPHEPIRSWQDFLLHLLTITIGLLIALALEAGVEALHYRHLVSEARANLRREISENHELYRQNLQNLEADRELLAHDIEQLREVRAGKPPEHLDLHWAFSWSSYVDSAWQSARDIGAVPHMRSEMIEAYSQTYNQQKFVNELGAGVLFDQAKAAAPMVFAKDHSNPKELLPGDIQTLMLSAAELSGRIVTIELMMKDLDEGYSSLLNGN